MRHLLPNDGQETTGATSSLRTEQSCWRWLYRQPLPQMVQWNRWRWARWRRGGTQELTGLDMVHFLAARTVVADTTVPVPICSDTLILGGQSFDVQALYL